MTRDEDTRSVGGGWFMLILRVDGWDMLDFVNNEGLALAVVAMMNAHYIRRDGRLLRRLFRSPLTRRREMMTRASD